MKLVLENVKNLNIFRRGIPIKQFKLTCEPEMEIEDVELALEKQRADFIKRKFEGRIQVSVYFKGIGWRSGLPTPIDQEISIFSPEKQYNEPDIDFNKKVSLVTMYFMADPPRAGGCNGMKNDCLYECILEALGEKQNLPEKIRTKSKFKERLGYERNAPVSIDSIPDLEEMLRAKITVIGDHEYISGKQHPVEIQLQLSNGHYTFIDHQHEKRLGVKLYNARLPENVVTYVNDLIITIYDGKSQRKISFEEFKEMESFKSRFHMIKCDSIANLQKARDDFIYNATTIKAMSDGKIDMFKYRDYANCAVDTWRDSARGLKDPQTIDEVEGLILSKTMRGGILYAEKGYKGFGVTYDCNSRYCTILASQNFYVVMSEGEAKTMTTEDFNSRLKYSSEGRFPYGMYHVKITGNSKFFMKSKNNWYTHFDLRSALFCGLQMEIIQDGETNWYSYDKTPKIKSRDIFGAWVHTLNELKKRGAPVKGIMSSLWGKLCEKSRQKKYLKHDEVYHIPDHKELVSICPGKDDKSVSISERDIGRVFKTDYARIGAFLTSYARMDFLRTIKPYEENIIHVHTDSVTFNKDIFTYFKIGSGLGDFKIENKGEVEVKNIYCKTYFNEIIYPP